MVDDVVGGVVVGCGMTLGVSNQYWGVLPACARDGESITCAESKSVTEISEGGDALHVGVVGVLVLLLAWGCRMAVGVSNQYW